MDLSCMYSFLFLFAVVFTNLQTKLIFGFFIVSEGWHVTFSMLADKVLKKLAVYQY